ncbi:MAG: Gfo/Idh/MocA family oxidoreductase [Tannerella sp.]|jgi:predicted dehydrogenase|nr:Gfo/Idh/MocA family oxidoreductase [Tannerella sp.]
MKDITLNDNAAISRRDFFRNMGALGSGSLLLSAFPWLQSCGDDVKKTVDSGEKLRLGIVGTGSRGQYHMQNLLRIPNADIVALCDDFEPHLRQAAAICPQATTCADYRSLLDKKDIHAVLVATPLDMHAPITIEALQAGKHVLCEKSMALTPEDCLAMYRAYKDSGKVLYIGQQRLFDPKFVRAMEMIHSGVIGTVGGIRTYWFRNNDWRRPVPSPEYERKINWRLYKQFSGGLMTELATHQLQVGNWAMRMIPDTVTGYGDIVYWKDGREVYDNVSLIYRYPGGVKMTYESIISNKFLGLEEEILCSRGTMEPEKGKYYFEDVQPAPGIMQLINRIEHGIFDHVSFAGASWVPETATKNAGYFIVDNASTHEGESTVGFVDDGSMQLLASFCKAAITGRPVEALVEEAYYSSVLALLGLQAMNEQRIVTFPDEYKIPYLNFA